MADATPEGYREAALRASTLHFVSLAMTRGITLIALPLQPYKQHHLGLTQASQYKVNWHIYFKLR
jgi:hypothetical protein